MKNKGKGIFALREISAGEVVIKEKPLVLLTTPHTPKTLAKHVAELRLKVKSLNEDRQEEFFSLSIARPELCTKDRGQHKLSSLNLCFFKSFAEYPIKVSKLYHQQLES